MTQPTPFLRMAAALLALVGLFDSLYLSLERAAGGSVLCPTGGGCEAVAESPYALLFGALPLSTLGAAAYAAMLAIAIASLYRGAVGPASLPLALLALASVGVATSAYLVYLQLAVIQAICFWCMVSAGTQAAIWVLAALIWRGARAH